MICLWRSACGEEFAEGMLKFPMLADLDGLE